MASASCACTTVAGHWPGSPWHKSVAGSCEKQKKKKSPKVLIQYILCNVHCQKVIHVFTIHCAAHLQPLNLLGRELVGVQDLAQGYYYQTEKKSLNETSFEQVSKYIQSVPTPFSSPGLFGVLKQKHRTSTLLQPLTCYSKLSEGDKNTTYQKWIKDKNTGRKMQ